MNAGITYTGVYFKMMNDISLTGYANWDPIGNSSTKYFMGVFDGNNKMITGLTITGTSTYRGLFGHIQAGCEIKNLSVESCNIAGSLYIGGLVGCLYLNTASKAITISNCYTSGTVSGTNQNIGGLIGFVSYGTDGSGGETYNIFINNCSSSANVSNSTLAGVKIGGLIGSIEGINATKNPRVSNCYSVGNITTTTTGVFSGGLIGYNSYSSITNCYSRCAVSATGATSNAGGLIGYNSNSNVTNCYAYGKVTGTAVAVLGFIGSYVSGTITSCYWDTETSTKATSAGGAGVTGKTTAQMKTLATYSGWDFATIWSYKDGYPLLAAQNVFVSETGTSGDPFKITTPEQLKQLAINTSGGTAYAGKYFKLMNDISLTAYANWMPIGKNIATSPSFIGNPFSGNFNGDSHTISGLTIIMPNTAADYGKGLFGWVGSSGSVSNLNVTGLSMTLPAAPVNTQWVGGVVGLNHGTIDGCTSSGNITVTGGNPGTTSVGGIAGENNGGASVVKNSNSSVNITGGSYAGGLVGINQGTIDNSHASGTMSGGYQRIGGLVGRNLSTSATELGIVKNSYSTGSVTGSYNYIGGLIGQSQFTGTQTTVGYIKNCYSSGAVTGIGSYVGGFIGGATSSNAGTSGGGYIKNCHSLSNTTGTGSASYVGGFIGYYTNAYIGIVAGIENCYSSGSVSGSTTIGGFIGYTQNISGATYGGGYIKDCHSTGSVTASSTYSGGFMGYNKIEYRGTEVSYIENCWASGDVNGAMSTGGFIGYSTIIYNNVATNPGVGVDIKGYVKNCYASGDVVSTSSSTGGFVGHNHFWYSQSLAPLPSDLKLFGHLEQCYSTGDVTGTGVQVGGFVGYNRGAFTDGTLPTNRAVGGSIHDCYSWGNVIRASGGTETLIGGFCGENNYIINRCYALGSVTYTDGTNPNDKGFLGKKTATDVKVLNQTNGNFWNTTTSAQSTDLAGAATGKTTAEMKRHSTFTDAVWDFKNETANGTNDYWGINFVENGGYPFLQLQGYSSDLPIIAPTTQASAVGFSTVKNTQMTIGWTIGNGTKRAVFVRQGNTGTATPADYTTYTANAAFSSGTQIGSTTWYCVYNGTGTNVTVTGLTLGTDYIVQVFEYNGGADLEKYLTTTATDNPKSQTTASYNTYTVISSAETGAGTLKNLITGAAAGDFINFNTTSMGGNTIKLTSPVVIDKDLTIQGPDGGIVLDGNSVTRVITNRHGSTTRLEKLIIKNGNDPLVTVGGVLNEGNLTLVNCVVSDNTATGSMAVGGVLSFDTFPLDGDILTLINATIAGNTGDPMDGAGGLYSEDEVNIYNSIIYGNTGFYSDVDETINEIAKSYNALYGNDVSAKITLGAGNLYGVDPKFVGGTLHPYAICGNSVAVDAGNDTYCSETTDLRGTTRKLSKIDGTAGTVDMGAYEWRFGTDPLMFTWDGSESEDWNVAANWDLNLVPTSTDVIRIPDVTTKPILDVLTIAAEEELTIDPKGSLTLSGSITNNGRIIIKSQDGWTGSLITGGGSGTGSAFVERFMPQDEWHIISSPTGDQLINNFLADNLAIPYIPASGIIPDKYGMMDYNSGENKWNDYFTSANTSPLGLGKGYMVRVKNPVENLRFQGVINAPATTNVSVGWNCIGNPFTSTIKINTLAGTDNFMDVNWTKFDDSNKALYLWNQTNNSGTGSYDVVNLADAAAYAQVGQGFFMKVKAVGTVSFTAAMQSHQTTAPFKASAAPYPEIKLIAATNGKTVSTDIKFIEGTQKGLDPGYDAGLFTTDKSFSIYTKLVEDNGVEFQLQCLPPSGYDKMLIPVGIYSKVAGEIVLSVQAVQLDPKCKVILEDKLTNTFTDLSKGSYKTAVVADTKGADRFFLHTGDIISGLEDQSLAYGKLTAYAKGNKEIRVIGEVGNDAVATLVNGLGQVVLIKKLGAGSLNIIGLPNLKSGLYMLNINDNGTSQTIKIMIRK